MNNLLLSGFSACFKKAWAGSSKRKVNQSQSYETVTSQTLRTIKKSPVASSKYGFMQFYAFQPQINLVGDCPKVAEDGARTLIYCGTFLQGPAVTY